MDNFYEQLVTTQKTAKYKIANSATYVLGVLGLLFVGGPGIIIGIVFIAAAVGLFFLKRNFYVEYEYDFTNGEIDVDKIYEMKTRKRAFSFSVKDLELLAPEGSYHINDFGNKPDKVVNLYPETTEAKIYVGMLTGGTERAQVRFVPDEQLLEYCYKYNPRAVKKTV
jgi:hypothetical protein